MVIFWIDIILSLVLCLTLLRLVFDTPYRHRWHRTLDTALRSGGWFWLILLAWVALTTSWIKYPLLGHHTTISLLLNLNFALVLGNLDRSTYHQVLGVFLAAATGQSLIALLQLIRGKAVGLSALGEIDLTIHDSIRGYGLTVNPNNLAGYLMVALFAAFSLWQCYPSNRWVWVGILIVSLGLLATLSRTVLSIMSLMLLLWGFRHFPKRVAYSIGMIVLIIMLGLIAIRQTFFGSNLSWEDEITQRLFFAYDDTLTVLSKSPLVGVGANHLMINIADSNPDPQILPAHNAYLVIWAELGLVGLGLVGLGYGYVIFDWYHQISASIWVFCLLAIAGVMLFDFYFWGDGRSRVLMLVVWGFWWAEQRLLIEESDDRFAPTHSNLY